MSQEMAGSGVLLALRDKKIGLLGGCMNKTPWFRYHGKPSGEWQGDTAFAGGELLS
jgi:hypothetical protein